MSSPVGEESNPYRAPATAAAAPLEPATVDDKTLKSFRRHIVGLGVFWIIMGLLNGFFLAMFLPAMSRAPAELRTELTVSLGLMGLLAASFLTLGVAACRKNLWAVYVGLGITLLGAINLLFQGNLCPLLVMVVVILHAVQTTRLANRLTAAGVPLTAKPARV